MSLPSFVKVGHIDEAIACGMGFRSRASLLKTLKEDEEEGVVRPLSIIPEDFKERLCALSKYSVEEDFFLRKMLTLLACERGTLVAGSPEVQYYESENDVEDVVNVTLTRVPNVLDLEVHSLDMKNFTEAFNNNTLPNKPMTALGLQTHDAIYIGGCWLGFAAVADNWASIERVSCQTL